MGIATEHGQGGANFRLSPQKINAPTRASPSPSLTLSLSHSLSLSLTLSPSHSLSQNTPFPTFTPVAAPFFHANRPLTTVWMIPSDISTGDW